MPSARAISDSAVTGGVDHEAAQAAGFYGRCRTRPRTPTNGSQHRCPDPETDAGWTKQAEARMAKLAS